MTTAEAKPVPCPVCGTGHISKASESLLLTLFQQAMTTLSKEQLMAVEAILLAAKARAESAGLCKVCRRPTQRVELDGGCGRPDCRRREVKE